LGGGNDKLHKKGLMPKIKENRCKEIKIHKLKHLSAKPKELVKVESQKISRPIFNPIFV
jgi:hypothetical protein